MLFENQRESYLKAAEFGGCDQVPCSVTFSPATWHKHREKLNDFITRYPALLDEVERHDFNSFGPAYREGELYADNWGCIWNNAAGGLEGQVKVHPLTDWSALKSFKAPNPLTATERGKRESWETIELRLSEARKSGRLLWGTSQANIRFFERLHFLRGFTNLMLDFYNGTAELNELIEMILNHNVRAINKWLEFDIDVMEAGDDLGTQKSLMINPKTFRKYLLPGYTWMFQPILEKGVHLHFHTDGHVLEIVDDLKQSGVTVQYLQSRPNGIDDIQKKCRGRICVCIDIDQQYILPYGTPHQITKHVKEVVDKLGSKDGGLMIIAAIKPEVPLKNIESVCKALENYRYI